MVKSLIDITRKYLKTFSNKDLSGLEKMFSRDISLRDWGIEAAGIDEVLKVNKNIFESVDSIKLKLLRIYNEGNTIIAELKIDINNGANKLVVVDVIEYDNENKVTTIWT